MSALDRLEALEGTPAFPLPRRRTLALAVVWLVVLADAGAIVWLYPTERAAVAKVLEARDLAIATSGAYLRGQHVIDPHTGRPPEGILSVTVTGLELATADAYATAAFAMGARVAPHWLARLRGYESLI